MSNHIPSHFHSTRPFFLLRSVNRLPKNIPLPIPPFVGVCRARLVLWCRTNLADNVLAVFDFQIGHAPDGADLLYCRELSQLDDRVLAG